MRYFRQPQDILGKPLMCGQEACPAMSTAKGVVRIRIPSKPVAPLRTSKLLLGRKSKAPIHCNKYREQQKHQDHRQSHFT